MNVSEFAHAQLIALYGRTEGKVCEKCASLASPRRKGGNKRCALSSAPNWRDSWEACGRYMEVQPVSRKLMAVAMRMYQEARDNQDPPKETAARMTRMLQRGLAMRLTIQRGEYHMLLWREGAMPAEMEESIIREQFGVPRDARRDVSPTTFHVRYIWPVPQGDSVEMAAEARTAEIDFR